jgi:hypothetical protein
MKAVTTILVPILLAISGTLFSESSSAQVGPSKKVSSALAPLFEKSQKEREPVLPCLAAIALEALLRGRQISGDVCPASSAREQAYPSIDRYKERSPLLGTVDSHLPLGEQLAPFIKQTKAQEAQ